MEFAAAARAEWARDLSVHGPAQRGVEGVGDGLDPAVEHRDPEGARAVQLAQVDPHGSDLAPGVARLSFRVDGHARGSCADDEGKRKPRVAETAHDPGLPRRT